jgi:hypothetical protein
MIFHIHFVLSSVNGEIVEYQAYFHRMMLLIRSECGHLIGERTYFLFIEGFSE